MLLLTRVQRAEKVARLRHFLLFDTLTKLVEFRSIEIFQFALPNGVELAVIFSEEEETRRTLDRWEREEKSST